VSRDELSIKVKIGKERLFENKLFSGMYVPENMKTAISTLQGIVNR